MQDYLEELLELPEDALFDDDLDLVDDYCEM